VKFGIESLHVISLCLLEWCKAVNKRVPVLSTVFPGLDDTGYKMHTNVLSNCNFRENLGSEGHNLFRSVNEFISFFSIFIVIYR